MIFYDEDELRFLDSQCSTEDWAGQLLCEHWRELQACALAWGLRYMSEDMLVVERHRRFSLGIEDHIRTQEMIKEALRIQTALAMQHSTIV